MHPDDRVLVGVISRKRDFNHLVQERWYRIPQVKMLDGIDAEYIAFFLSGSSFKEQSGGIHFYARISGLELRYRHELLPLETDHPRANEVYYRISFTGLTQKIPPILNPDKRSFAFVYTTWDRFIVAVSIADLYSVEPQFVERTSNHPGSEDGPEQYYLPGMRPSNGGDDYF